jgi:phosphoribosyl-ATP pyrophosphohydrolase
VLIKELIRKTKLNINVSLLTGKTDPKESWTAKLLAKGPEKCAEKFGEEAIEAIIEAVKDDKTQLTSEAADVLFHLLVMLKSRDVALSDVMDELARRQGQSGLSEKAARDP